MDRDYDMYIDQQTLDQLSIKLKKISTQLSEATKKMIEVLQESQNFLSGNQYEKARSLTLQTVETTTLTANNIDHALTFLSDLDSSVSYYSTCQYQGGR